MRTTGTPYPSILPLHSKHLPLHLPSNLPCHPKHLPALLSKISALSSEAPALSSKTPGSSIQKKKMKKKNEKQLPCHTLASKTLAFSSQSLSSLPSKITTFPVEQIFPSKENFLIGKLYTYSSSKTAQDLHKIKNVYCLSLIGSK